MRLVRRATQEGDTLIEVMFAFAIFALVAVGSLTIMNQGIAAAQRSLEITLVRAQMDAQAEAIRYIHQSYVAAYQKDGPAPNGVAAEWVKMTSKTTGKGADSASEYGVTNGSLCPATTPGQRPFILNARMAKMENAVPLSSAVIGSSLPPFSQVIYNADSSVNQAYGIWVEAVPSASANGTGFVDFHIRACWSGAGSATPVTLGTIVRLYEPR
jgi:type II secretory pathway component PulJ